MNLKSNQLINLPVFTEAGQKLGKVSGFELETERQIIVRYYVKGENILREIIGQELIIGVEQVLTIDDQKMVVEDLVLKERAAVKEKVSAVPV